MVVIGTVAVRGIAPKDNSQIHPTSLWSVSSLTSMFQPSDGVESLLSNVMQGVGLTPTRNLKKPTTPFKPTTARQHHKIAAAEKKENFLKYQKRNPTMKKVKDSKMNLQWEDWGDTTDTRQWCSTSADCEDGFCNMDEGDGGFCEPCSFFESQDQCYNDGLPQAGADQCAERCYGSTSDTVSTTFAGDEVWSFPFTDETGTLTDT